MKKVVCEIKGDGSEILKTLSELESYLPRLSRKGIIRLTNFLDNPTKVVRFENHPTAEGTGVVILVKPSDRLLNFLAAIRAGDFDNSIFKRRGHGGLRINQ